MSGQNPNFAFLSLPHQQLLAACPPRTWQVSQVYISPNIVLTIFQQFIGALRITARATHNSRIASQQHRLNFHSFSRPPSSLLRASASHSGPTYSILKLNSVLLLTTSCQQHRSLSLGSLFTRAKPVQTPSPGIVAVIARIETEANSAPNDVAKQLALFNALIDTKTKAGSDLVATRWERMCEFVESPHSCILHV